jgi:U3 small nucleolar RNA-associated protein 25
MALTQTSRDAVDRRAWILSKDKLGKLGTVVISALEGVKLGSVVSHEQKIPVRITTIKYVVGNNFNPYQILERLRTPFENRQAKQPKGQCSPFLTKIRSNNSRRSIRTPE